MYETVGVKVEWYDLSDVFDFKLVRGKVVVNFLYQFYKIQNHS